jgi:hypothetical protein
VSHVPAAVLLPRPCLVAGVLSCSYMYLGMALHQLRDFDNAAAAYDKAVSLEPAEPLLHLNYGKQVRASLHGLTVRPYVARPYPA